MAREAGILAPVSTLVSDHGIGDFGKYTYDFIDHIKETGFKTWQILPLNSAGYGNSPYQPYSSYAGDRVYISLDTLVEWNLLKAEDIKPYEPSNLIDFEAVRAYKEIYLKRAFDCCMETGIYRDGFHYFKENHPWVFDWAVFITFKKLNDGNCWNEWPEDQKNWIGTYRYNVEMHRPLLEYEMFVQYIFYEQWFRLKKYANDQGIKILGDIPIYVGIDSCDVWCHKDCFLLDPDGNPSFVAGVPPDYFSPTGQRWGNPIYNWDVLEKTNFQFWINRLAWSQSLFDIVRIDHFRGFDTYWKIPSSCPTAEMGEWLEAPGYALFDEVYKQLPNIEIVAEDLGDLREEVLELRDHYHLSGMKIVQFELDPYGTNTDFHEKENTIVYTGTHDNETLVGWYGNLTSYQKRLLAKRFMKYKERKCTDRILHAVFDCLADRVIIPIQDILGLGNEARLNTPGTVGSPNWQWHLLDFDAFYRQLPRFKTWIEESKR